MGFSVWKFTRHMEATYRFANPRHDKQTFRLIFFLSLPIPLSFSYSSSSSFSSSLFSLSSPPSALVLSSPRMKATKPTLQLTVTD